MKTYIILLRGINVGGRNILPMKELVSLMESIGCQDVKTYIQSGNVVAKCSGMPGQSISNAAMAQYGFSPDVVAFEKAEIRTLVENIPFATDSGKALHFYFACGKFKPDMERIESLLSPTEKFEVGEKVFYLYAPDGIGRSKLVNNIDTCLGVRVTGRNLNTMTKLLLLAENA